METRRANPREGNYEKSFTMDLNQLNIYNLLIQLEQ